MAIKTRFKNGSTTSGYAPDILEIAPGCNVAKVEDAMRVMHGTLDHLTRAEFRRAVRDAVEAVEVIERG